MMRYFLLICLFAGTSVSCKMTQPVSQISPSITSTTAAYAQDLQFQLSTPSIISESVLFYKENPVQLVLNLEGTRLHYTLDGSEPDETSPLYQGQILLKESTFLKVKAFHPQSLASETVSARFIQLKDPLSIKNISINRTPHENYPGTGAQGLIDRQKGSTNFRTDHWIGFAGGDLETNIEFKQETSIQKVTASLLSDQKSWIFLPESIEIHASSDGKKFSHLKTKAIEPSAEKESSKLIFADVKFPKTSANFVKIILKNIPAIPEWHAGKGTAPWLFVDEILIE